MWCFITIILITQCCALKQPLRIYGGIDAKPDEYPYIIRIEIQRYYHLKNNSIVYEHDHLCTGSALSSEWVLSAAHCFGGLSDRHIGAPYSVEKLVVRYGHVEHLAGIHDSFSDVLFTIMYPTFYIPLYTIHNFGATKNDIGLLKTHPMNIINYIKLSAVDYKSFYGHEAVFAGFGITTKKLPDGQIETDDTLNLKKPLQVLKVLITKCIPAENWFLGLCLAPRCGHVSLVCGGDSGGPVLHPSGVIGVLSQGPQSALCLDSTEETNRLAGYVIPVSPYIEWIYNIIKNK